MFFVQVAVFLTKVAMFFIQVAVFFVQVAMFLKQITAYLNKVAMFFSNITAFLNKITALSDEKTSENLDNKRIFMNNSGRLFFLTGISRNKPCGFNRKIKDF